MSYQPFFVPFGYKNKLGYNLIIYPIKDLEDQRSLKDRFATKVDLQNYIDNLYQRLHDNNTYNNQNYNIFKGDYHIVFFRNFRNDKIIVDIWIHTFFNQSAYCGPTVECHSYEDEDLIYGTDMMSQIGNASGDCLIALGAEEQFRRNMGGDMNRFLNRNSNNLPQYPSSIYPTEEFSY